ncbi:MULTISPECIES: adenine phosphoribosyltransferase [Anaerococcus]|uniref:Adenine phosphoribosyltransferase n=1 Tax=Anaerococcus nagyae TaxID=1755241 RepID=A0A3E2TFV1_9FIRM|nr:MULTISPECIES: adenine phosphoribosyltransferase [Anaerococcus]MBP2070227.1 adenine phosphoribosyltransferase [Anaerococcus nagyae]MDU1829289.1 adenine phosphoribosyltransferase [Anaerococcus sp.]MDU1864039.1 adenine phosphoribosyltransferase [Anaerococcus sp.]MDU2353995.1 adenine phosphoribosyltransferase [Anaerococcus sp.]MDU2566149.1 adenine phosphoribosyltransferase [Anaerococcus sp.]
MDIKSTIRVIEGYPIEGISFKDITTLLKNKEAFEESLDLLEKEIKDLDFDYIVGIESRGFIFGAPLADRLNKGFIPIRKPGKLPGEIEKISYDLEYGENELEMHKDALNPGEKVVIVDDLIATGGSAKAAANLIESLGAEVAAFEFLIELEDLNGRDVLNDYKVISVVKYDH